MKQRSASQRYAEMVSAGDIQTDAAQREVIAQLTLAGEHVYEAGEILPHRVELLTRAERVEVKLR